MKLMKSILTLCLLMCIVLPSLAGDCSVLVKIIPPVSSGSSPLLGYFIEQKSVESSEWEQVAKVPYFPRSEYTIKAFFKNEEYQFRAIAYTKVGQSKPSKPSKPVDLSGNIETGVTVSCESIYKSLSRSAAMPYEIPDFGKLPNVSDVKIPYRR